MTEKRNFVHEIEIREENGEKTVRGYAVKWGKLSHKIAGRFTERFQKGAFSESLRSDDQLALWSHDISKVLGRTKNNTLRLLEDDIGLRFELDLPNTTLGNDTYESVKRSDIDGVSFGFRAEKQGWENRNTDNVIRTVTKAKLTEISLVGLPAYPDSEVSTRGYDPYEAYMEEKMQSQKRKRLYLQTLI